MGSNELDFEIIHKNKKDKLMNFYLISFLAHVFYFKCVGKPLYPPE